MNSISLQDLRDSDDFQEGLDSAHRIVRSYCKSSNRGTSRDDLVLAAGRCLHSSEEVVQSNGASVLVEIAEEDAVRTVPVFDDLAACVESADSETRIQILAVLQEIVAFSPPLGTDVLDVILSGLNDDEALVREIVCSMIFHIAYSLGDGFGPIDFHFDNLSQEKCEKIAQVMYLLFEQVGVEVSENKFGWRASIQVDYLSSVFCGDVEYGEDRREYIEWHAVSAIAGLSRVFPDIVSNNRESLFEASIGGGRSETRWYAVDALGRAGCTDTLRRVRDQAFDCLDDSAKLGEGAERLYHISFEGADVLAERVGELAYRFEVFEEGNQRLVAEALIRSAVCVGDGFVEEMAGVRACPNT